MSRARRSPAQRAGLGLDSERRSLRLVGVPPLSVDRDGDGHIEPKELQRVMGDIGCPVDYEEVQSPVHRLTAFNLVLAIAAVKGSWLLHHSDVTAGFAQVKKACAAYARPDPCGCEFS